MVRRCLEGGRRFGIVPMINGKLSEVGTTAHIENHWIFPDGRSLVITTGETRFKVKETYDLDGYTVAVVEYIVENALPTIPQELNLLNQKFAKLKALVTEKLADVPQIEEKCGQMPTDILPFSFWVGSALPINAQAKEEILSTVSTNERFDLVLKHLKTNLSTTNYMIS